MKLPIGLSDFKKLIENDYYFIDKSLFIKEIIDNSSEVILLPRPRRFGKTLNLSMLRYFYEKTETDCRDIFKNLKIWEQGAEYTSRQGIYPTIFLTFKDIKSLDWADCFQLLKMTIAHEFKRHSYLLDDDSLENWDRQTFQNIIYLEAEKGDYLQSLLFLSRLLERYHGEKVIILIDEYDTPVQAGYINNYYDLIIDFMRGFLGAGLKDNSALEKSVVTGIMRISRESIFSGLNNLTDLTMHPEYATMLGYTQQELEYNFSEEIEVVAPKMGLTRSALLEEMRVW